MEVKLSDVHDCPQSHNKIILISIDDVGVTRCGYCNSVVDYRMYHNKIYKEMMDSNLIKFPKKEDKQWQKKNNLKKKRKKK